MTPQSSRGIGQMMQGELLLPAPQSAAKIVHLINLAQIDTDVCVIRSNSSLLLHQHIKTGELIRGCVVLNKHGGAQVGSSSSPTVWKRFGILALYCGQLISQTWG